MTAKRQYLVNEDVLANWRNRLSTASRYPKVLEGTEEALSDVIRSIDSILASGNYQEE